MTKGVSRYIIPQNATCHSERSEESRVHQVGVTEILRFALDDKIKISIIDQGYRPYLDISLEGRS